MKLYFNISEFLIDPEMDQVPLHVADKIVQHHIAIINPIREKKGSAIFVSQNSGFRPLAWELAHGRSGDSQHTFGDGKDHPEQYWGAADYTCDDIEWLFEELKKSSYRRVCIYRKEGFVHADHKGIEKVAFESIQGTWNKVAR